jgi:hypothetical protein
MPTGNNELSKGQILILSDGRYGFVNERRYEDLMHALLIILTAVRCEIDSLDDAYYDKSSSVVNKGSLDANSSISVFVVRDQ